MYGLRTLGVGAVLLGTLPQLAVAAESSADVAVVAAAADTRARDTPSGNVNGLFPLWEQTASIHGSMHGQVGWRHAQFAYGPVQIGSQPILDLYGMWNAQLKLQIWNSGGSQGALVAGVYWVPTAAESRAVGNLHAAGFGNPYQPVWLIPLAFAKAWSLHRRLDLHWTTAALISVSSEASQNHLSLGQNVLARFFASSHWALQFHAGVEGLLVQPSGHLGLSAAIVTDAFVLAAGMARKMTFEGESSNQVLFDASVLF